MTIRYIISRRSDKDLIVIGLLFFLVFSLNVTSTSPSAIEVPTDSVSTASAETLIVMSVEVAKLAVPATTTASIIKDVVLPTKIPSNMEIMAWIYPGKPTCGAVAEYTDGRKIDVLKPEYFMISEEGRLVLLTEKEHGCNGFSEKNIAVLQKYSKEQYATISSSDSGNMSLFLGDMGNASENIDMLISFAVDNKMTGIELDFEDFGGWNVEMYANYKQFVTRLGNALHEKNKKLMVDGPATSNAVEQAWYMWRYEDFLTLPVDRVVVMTYDYQFDQGAGQPVSPISWIQDIIKWTVSQFPNKSKLSFGIPSYGYRGTEGAQRFSLLTYEQMQKEPGFSTALRDKDSFEMTWRTGDTIYFFQDEVSMSKKLQVIQAMGIASVSVWHLGGNQWFAK